MMPMHGTTILETVESDDIHWDDRFDAERITISRWLQAKHWYPCSEKVVRRTLNVSLPRPNTAPVRRDP